MNKNPTKFSIYHYLAVFLLLAVWTIFSKHGAINLDGAMYLHQAYLFSIGDFEGAMEMYPWPFFPYALGMLHHYFGFSLLYSAHFILTLCFLMACYFYLRVLFIITNHQRILFAGFLTIITFIPVTDDYLGQIFRDQGYWAGLMAGLYFFICWVKSKKIIDSLLWQLSFLLAGLFRPEAIVFNFFLPFLMVFLIHPSNGGRLRNFLFGFSLVAVSSIVVLAYFLITHSEFNFSQISFSRLSDLIVNRPLIFLKNLVNSQPIYVSGLPEKYVNAYGYSIKYLFWVYVLLCSWLSGLKFLHIGGAMLAIIKKIVARPYSQILLIFFLITLGPVLVNVFSIFSFSSRYFVPNFWIVCILTALGIDFYLSWVDKLSLRKRLFFRFVFYFFIFTYVTVVLFESHKPSKGLADRESVHWIQSNRIPLNQVFYSNERMLFYAGALDRRVSTLDLSKHVAEEQRYFVVENKNVENLTQHLPELHLIKNIPSNDDPRVKIYKR